MFQFKKLFLIILFIYSFENVYSKEYKDLNHYVQDHPQGNHNGKDGNWLSEDREKATPIWEQANKTNIKQADGFKEYQSISERSDFYKWFQHQTDSLGFETKWSFAAAITTKKLEKLLTGAAEFTGNSNQEIQTFINEGNKIIFNDIWIDLRSLYSSNPIKGKEAELWDGNLLFKEQHLIEPYYQKLSSTSLAKLEKLLKKENFFSRLLPGYEFEGNLLSVKDRWFYGMKMMQYKSPDVNTMFPEN
jgi:hypothetical protein